MSKVKINSTKIETLKQCKIIETKKIHIEFKMIKCKLTIQVVQGWSSYSSPINRQCFSQLIITWRLDA
jgi:hypothetical protein